MLRPICSDCWRLFKWFRFNVDDSSLVSMRGGVRICFMIVKQRSNKTHSMINNFDFAMLNALQICTTYRSRPVHLNVITLNEIIPFIFVKYCGNLFIQILFKE